jgi:hypothetical protein
MRGEEEKERGNRMQADAGRRLEIFNQAQMFQRRSIGHKRRVFG